MKNILEANPSLIKDLKKCDMQDYNFQQPHNDNRRHIEVGDVSFWAVELVYDHFTARTKKVDVFVVNVGLEWTFKYNV